MSQGNERSLHQIKLETEQARAGLTDTVEQLRSQFSETASDIRDKISPDTIKAEVTDYIRSRGEHLRDSVTKAARDNPMQAMAVGVGVAYPLFRIARSIPLPVLMIGAGLYFAGSKAGHDAGRKASRLASDVADDLSRRSHDARDAFSSAQRRAAHRLDDVSAAVSSSISSGLETLREGRDAASNAVLDGVNSLRQQRGVTSDAIASSANDFRHQASIAKDAWSATAADATAKFSEEAGERVATASAGLNTLKDQAADVIGSATELAQEYASRAASTFRNAADTAAERAIRTRAQAAELSQRAGTTFAETVQQNPLAVAGIGLAIGALIASCIPASDTERSVAGKAGDAVRNRVRDAASQGIGAAKDIASGVYGDVTQRLADEGLDADGLKETVQGIGDRVRRVAEKTVATAFELNSAPKRH